MALPLLALKAVLAPARTAPASIANDGFPSKLQHRSSQKDQPRKNGNSLLSTAIHLVLQCSFGSLAHASTECMVTAFGPEVRSAGFPGSRTNPARNRDRRQKPGRMLTRSKSWLPRWSPPREAHWSASSCRGKPRRPARIGFRQPARLGPAARSKDRRTDAAGRQKRREAALPRPSAPRPHRQARADQRCPAGWCRRGPE